MNAVAYMRCSGMGQISGDTWDRQRETISKFAAAHDYVLEHEYTEEGVSGKTEADDRPAFQQMISDLLGNGCRTVIVEGLDRLAREYRIQEQLITYIASKGIALISANTGEDITAAMMGDPMRRAMVQMQGVFAELDKNMLVKKLRSARERKKERSGRCEGQKPFGTLPGEDVVLRDILLYYREFCYNAEDIAALLNEANVSTRSGGKWHAAVIRRILKREKGA